MTFGSAGPYAELESRLIDLIYASLVNESAWADFLAEVASCTPNGQSTLFFHDQLAETGALSLTHGVDPAFQRLYPQYAPRNLWMRNLHKRPVGLGTRADFMCPFPVVQRSEYYNELLKPFGIHGGVGITLVQDGTRSFMLSVVGARREAGDEQAAADMLTRLAPHLTRVFALHRQAQARASTLAVAQSISTIGVGVMTVGSGGVVQWANDTARALLSKGEGVGIDAAGRLRLGSPDLEDALKRMLAFLPDDEPLPRTISGTLRRPGAARTMKVTLAHSGQSLIERYFAGPTVVVVVDGRDGGAGAISPERLVARFNLTRRELDITLNLAQGLSIRAIADKWDISPDTVRVHLKHVFSKVGVKRQAELLATVFREAAQED
ncbi:response regulator transcription factor [Xanthobacter sp. AM11]|uniref:response regulator transcription factor n=1 Tax=Xanthobacter sp. AM11 TaxID=3380643 RepID=UPI0039BF5CD8